MPSITARLRDAASRLSARDLWAYSLVPLVLAALNGTKIRDVLTSPYDFHVGFSFGVPLPVTDVWAFVSTPTGGGVQVGPTATTLAIGTLAVGLVLQGLLLSGYLGGLVRRLRGNEGGLRDDVGRYFLRLFGFSLVILGLFLPPALFTLAGAALWPLVLIWLLLFLAVGYCCYAAPYLVVLHDVSLGRALSRSVSLALSGGAYFRYAVGYALLVLVVSIPTTLVVVNVPLLGIVVGVVAMAPVGLVFDTATLLFVADLTDAPKLGTDGTPRVDHGESSVEGTVADDSEKESAGGDPNDDDPTALGSTDRR